MLDFFSKIFDSEFMPHGHCYLWKPEILWLHVVSDIVIAISYYSIPIVLICFVKKRKDLKFGWIYLMFALFIFACGTTHLFEVWAVWHGTYRLQGLIKLVTAIVSFITALLLLKIFPQALSIPSKANLEEEVEKRRATEKELRKSQSLLEQRVAERTDQLNKQLVELNYLKESITNQGKELRAIIDLIPNFVFAKNRDGQFTLVNQAVADAYGTTVDDLIGKTDADFNLNKEEVEQFLNDDLGVMDSLETLMLAREKISDSNGQIRWLQTIKKPFDIVGGQARQVLGVSTDITELVRIDDLFRTAVEGAPNGMIMVNPQGKIELSNSQIEKMFKFSRDELLDQPIEILIPTDYRKQHVKERRDYYDKPETRQMGVGRDLYAQRKDKSKFPVEIGLNPITKEDGVHVLAVIVDITERKRIENEVILSNKEMQQLLYVVSHDLKSPLVTTQGFIGLLARYIEENNKEKIIDSMQRIQSANRKMNALINDLLEYGKVGQENKASERETILMNNFLNEVIEALIFKANKTSVSVVIKDNLPNLYANKSQIDRIFDNLISNALKYGCKTENSQIIISGQETDSGVVYRVQDFGPGIAEKYHQRIFTLFQRLESDSEGTGVGLAIVKKIMESYGGKVEVSSEEGKGSTFTLFFPYQ